MYEHTTLPLTACTRHAKLHLHTTKQPHSSSIGLGVGCSRTASICVPPVILSFCLNCVRSPQHMLLSPAARPPAAHNPTTSPNGGDKSTEALQRGSSGDGILHARGWRKPHHHRRRDDDASVLQPKWCRRGSLRRVFAPSCPGLCHLRSSTPGRRVASDRCFRWGHPPCKATDFVTAKEEERLGKAEDASS